MVENWGHKARVIAFYLPQFHPIPENDEFWGRGFTEWTNVTKAKPLFKGHVQPKLAGDLGYYDLRLSEARNAQAELAAEYGIEAFCYWHYWFGNGKRIIERPFAEVLATGKPDFPFCLAWANQSWTGIWHGEPNRILLEQNYPGKEDYINHFNTILPALKDHRYVLVDGKPLFLVYSPFEIPDVVEFIEIWREMAEKAGLSGIHLVAIGNNPKLIEMGFDACTAHAPTEHKKITKKLSVKKLKRFSKEPLPEVYSYKDFVEQSNNNDLPDFEYPGVLPNWDNTPRSGSNGLVLHDSRPELFETMLNKALVQVENRELEHKIVFLKSWNEWAEGNYVEPDSNYGKAYLETIRDVLV